MRERKPPGRLGTGYQESSLLGYIFAVPEEKELNHRKEVLAMDTKISRGERKREIADINHRLNEIFYRRAVILGTVAIGAGCTCTWLFEAANRMLSH